MSETRQMIDLKASGWENSHVLRPLTIGRVLYGPQFERVGNELRMIHPGYLDPEHTIRADLGDREALRRALVELATARSKLARISRLLNGEADRIEPEDR